MTQMLVDIGNTRIKWGVAKDSKIICGQPLVRQHLGHNELLTCWKNISAPACMAVSCVSSIESFELVRTVAASLWPDIEIVSAQTQEYAFGVRNAYIDTEKLGVDRWLALIAVRQHYQGYACIVDCGTAITIDLMDAAGCHLGGLIAPGLMLMKSSLAKGTEALMFDKKKYPIGLANTTDAAIYTGTLWSVIGLIEHIINKQPEFATLILTGGDADLIAEQLKYQSIVDADLVLRGLEILLAENQ
jgi:type III pantothenate kinase